MDTICPAGNIYTSAEQVWTFFEMLLDGGEYQGKQIMSAQNVFSVRPYRPLGQFRSTYLPNAFMHLGSNAGSNPVGLFGPNDWANFGHIGFSIFYAGPIQNVILVCRLPQENLSLGPLTCADKKMLHQISNNCPKSRKPNAAHYLQP